MKVKNISVKYSALQQVPLYYKLKVVCPVNHMYHLPHSLSKQTNLKWSVKHTLQLSLEKPH
jgi:hypothetical protein